MGDELNYPEDLKYNESHEWAKYKDNTITVEYQITLRRSYKMLSMSNYLKLAPTPSKRRNLE